MITAAAKPLGHKAYGSIPHLPGSRTGPADHTINDGMSRICCERVRDHRDTIVVQEKLDGSNCAVAKINGRIIALGRAGYLATSSRYEMHHRFAEWVAERESAFESLLGEGDRVCGEWLAQAHGTRYVPIPVEDLFRPFDIMWGLHRHSSAVVRDRCERVGLCPVTTLSVGGPVPVKKALRMLESSFYSLPTVEGWREGCVWRVERFDPDEGVVNVDFLAKYVRPEKVDGLYLNQDEPLWVEVLS